ncbi:MAG: AzlC family ABC transporter permease [Kineosporiaceae bacterium]|nr:AzlC family ABC transporter permease [Kineosporiaceae bacterium]MBK8076343.1 AzlC family ABC transporter permease [Kineosporiaceae bacterium]
MAAPYERATLATHPTDTTGRLPAVSPDTPDPSAARRAVVRQAASVGVATAAYGVSFGALSVASGLSLAQTCVLSLAMFTGGSQFAFVGVIGGGGGGAAAAATAGLLGVRNGFYGLQMAPLLRERGWRRPVAAQLTIDESTAVGTAQTSPELIRLGFWSTGIAVFVLWNLTTLLGALAGDAVGDPRTFGMDAAAAAAFLGLLWPRLRSLRPRAVALGSATLAAVLIPIVPAGIPVLATVLVALAGATVRADQPDVRSAS